MQVWITKYALTKGIFTADVEICADVNPDMVKVVESQDQDNVYYHGDVYYHGEDKDWHRSYLSAARRAVTMRDAKIESLQKQIIKLKRMEFPNG
jgi:hypothetical protein